MIRFPINLSLFQGEKTEQATSKKKRDARQKGQIPQTREAASALSLIVLFVFLGNFGFMFMQVFTRHYQSIMEYCVNPEPVFSIRSIVALGAKVSYDFVVMTFPILFVVMATGLTVTYMQVGVVFTSEPLMPKLDRMNPLSGFKRMFSMRALTDLGKASIKIFVMIWITYIYLKDKSALIVNMLDMDTWQIALNIWQVVFNVVIRNAVFLLVVAFFDYAFNLWEHNKNLKMSKQEVKEEYKQVEGDPLIKAKIKERQRQISMRRMMQEIPKADVVITNPTHFAVVIQYDSAKGAAPQVTAKGQDLIAMNIRKIAEANNIPIVENKPLARTLFSSVEIGGFIPPDLYQAVAEVLAYVYSLKKQ